MKWSILGYSRPDRENFVEKFANRWSAMCSKTHEQKMSVVFMMFEHEYNDVWTEQFSALEEWLEKNDAQREASKNGPRN